MNLTFDSRNLIQIMKSMLGVLTILLQPEIVIVQVRYAAGGFAAFDGKARPPCRNKLADFSKQPPTTIPSSERHVTQSELKSLIQMGKLQLMVQNHISSTSFPQCTDSSRPSSEIAAPTECNTFTASSGPTNGGQQRHLFRKVTARELGLVLMTLNETLLPWKGWRKRFPKESRWPLCGG